MFRLCLEHGSTLAVARTFNERGRRTKRWTTHKGVHGGGRRFGKTSAHKLLTSIVYIGRLRYKDDAYKSEHQRESSRGPVFSTVQRLLAKNVKNGGSAVRNKYNALLRGRLRCAACDCGMSHSYSKKGTRLYR